MARMTQPLGGEDPEDLHTRIQKLEAYMRDLQLTIVDLKDSLEAQRESGQRRSQDDKRGASGRGPSSPSYTPFSQQITPRNSYEKLEKPAHYYTEIREPSWVREEKRSRRRARHRDRDGGLDEENLYLHARYRRGRPAGEYESFEPDVPILTPHTRNQHHHKRRRRTMKQPKISIFDLFLPNCMMPI
ncbi:hypothetical protein M011DRAFT_324981 [Sporormia fimetaria CBS 119925]|uniref:Uncharacterized protein n=1 Tax=Sporormia fimetaria CBS 119925 TaxID=1340428 RepID=A0A6A6VFS5_9PLEO|nr:hypothetical protein M011DRAFT_324981 [Sporormia fimetaria CBS 119925]